MIELKIDNKTIKVEEGTPLIEAARSNGINIPSLCYKKGIPHYTSCMVCMVRDNGSNKFLPSCSALASQGQDIDASGIEVKKLREEALSLLLTEHRAECEAPCRNVCPAFYDIPKINRLITNKDLNSAYELIKESIDKYGFACESCKAPCEKACRRKMIDKTISIRNLIVLVHNIINMGDAGKDFIGIERSKKFNSVIGKIEDSEKMEWLKECDSPSERYEDPSNENEIASEAGNCMHCDCRASDNCVLRDLCYEYEVKNPGRLRSGPPIEKKINLENGLVFENAKCIKCGLCVRVSIDSTKSPAFCFTGRGFMSLISEPLTFEFADTYKVDARKVVDVCPTGALSIKAES